MSETVAAPRILVVEDDDGLRTSILDALMVRGYRTLEARDGEHALALLERLTPCPDLILLDLSLPNMTGAEVTAAISRDPRLAGIPVVLMTGWSPHSARGIVHRKLLRKPFTIEKLMQAVDACLRPAQSVAS